MRVSILIFSLWFSLNSLSAQLAFNPEIESYNKIILPEIDNKELNNRYNNQSDGTARPFQFAHPFDVDIKLEDFSLIENEDDLSMIYALEIYSKGAKSLNLGFEEFQIPQGAKLFLFDQNNKKWHGPFEKENKEVLEYWTPIINGDRLSIILKVNNTLMEEDISLKITCVNHDFIGFGQVISGSCNLDVACADADGYPEVDGYRDIIRSVGVYTSQGRWACSGALINTAAESCERYFLTANHCLSSENEANSVVIYWNFENSFCRTPGSGSSGGNGDGQLNQFNSGTSLKSTNLNSDFTLLEIEGEISQDVNAYLAGWNNERKAPENALSIHHPRTDEKRISFEFDPLYFASYLNDAQNNNADHIRIEDWDLGTTEGGSSGSPLFDEDSHIIGQLSGGYAACGNDEPDWYGAMASNFENGNNASNNITSWLDPNSSNQIKVTGVEYNRCGIVDDLLVVGIKDTVCSETDTLVYSLYNTENDSSIILNIDFGTNQANYEFIPSNTIIPGDSAALFLFGFNDFTPGDHIFSLSYMSNGSMLTNDYTLFKKAIPNPVSLIAPDPGLEINPHFLLDWSEELNSDYYIVSISRAADMTNSTTTTTVNSEYTFENLATNTNYYFRIEAINNCGASLSDIFSFRTKNWVCKTATYDTPTDILDLTNTTIDIEIEATDGLEYIEISNLDISHTNVRDLNIQLNSPNRLNISLMERVCRDDAGILLGFNDNGLDVIDCPPTSGLKYQPVSPFNSWYGRTDIDSLSLRISDVQPGNEGQLNEISISYCILAPPIEGFVTENYQATMYQTDTLGISLEIDTNALGGVVVLSSNISSSFNLDNFTPNFDQNPNDFKLVTAGTDTGNYEILFFAEGALGKDTLTLDLLVLPCNDYPELYPSPYNIETYYQNLKWEDTGADQYRLTISSTADHTQGLVYDSYVGQDTSYTTMVLPPDQKFYWNVRPEGACINPGENLDSFATVYDYTYQISDEIISLCQGDSSTIKITIGENYFDSLFLTIIGANTANFEFEYDTMALANSNIVEIQVSVGDSDPGNYSFFFVVSDRFIYEDAKVVQVNVLPNDVKATLGMPGFNEANVSQPITFTWDRAYSNSILEISDENNFDNILYSYDVSNLSSIEISDQLANETSYFWRIYNENICDTASSEGFKFTTEKPDANFEINGINITFYPNPTLDLLHVSSDSRIGKEEIILRDLMGRMLIKTSLSATLEKGYLDLNRISVGTYILELRLNESVIYKKINKI